MIPSDLKYSRDHEWLRAEDDGHYTVGVTDHAQRQLGDIVFYEAPAVGNAFEAGEATGTLESVKAVAEVFTPVTGTVVAVNEALNDSPELVNEDPYGEGWLFRIEAAGAPEGLMSADEYGQYVEAEVNE